MYMMTPEQHKQVVDALDCGDYDVQQVAREMLKSMQPVEPCAWGWHGGDGRMRDCIAPDTHAILEGDYTVPLYTPTKD